MKIATFNINNVNRRLPNLLEWLKESAPDVACLQELRMQHHEFPLKAIRDAGYGAIWRGQSPRFNGVAILAKGVEPMESRSELPGDASDKQARYIEAAVGGTLIGCIYAPNGNPQPGPKFDYKLAWMDRLLAHAATLLDSGLPVVLAGDYNVIPTDLDIYPTTSYDDDALLQPEPRERYKRLLAQGWIDCIRKRYPKERIYTYWDYMRNRWPRDAGLRIDHLLLPKNQARRLTGAGVDKWVRGREGASDHAPAWVTLKA